MQCHRCGLFFEGPFCPYCGVAAPAAPGGWETHVACGRCGRTFRGRFCPACAAPATLGTPVLRKPRSPFKEAFALAWLGGLVVFLVLLVTNLAALLWIAGPVARDILASGGCPVCAQFFLIVPFDPFLVGFATAEGVAFLVWFVFVVAVIVASVAYVLFGGLHRTATDIAQGARTLSARARSPSPLIQTAQLFLAVTFAQFVIVFAVIVAGQTPSAPVPAGNEPPAWFTLYALANASVYEELVARVLLIGVPMFFVGTLLAFSRGGQSEEAMARTSRGLLGTWRPNPAGYLLGGKVPPRGVITLALLVLSSISFGLAHWPSWQAPWKVVATAGAGFVIGYAFLRFGIASAVVLHFATDYMAGLVVLAGENFAALALVGILVLLVVAAGAVFFAYYVKRGVDVLIGQDRPPPAPPSPVFGYRCPRCGWMEARYVDGWMQCVRCGMTT